MEYHYIVIAYCDFFFIEWPFLSLAATMRFLFHEIWSELVIVALMGLLDDNVRYFFNYICTEV